MFEQVISFVGAALILAAYAANQKQWIGPHNRSYSLMNIVGSLLLLWVALADRRIGFIILEGAWAAASLPALVRPPQPPAAARATETTAAASQSEEP